MTTTNDTSINMDALNDLQARLSQLTAILTVTLDEDYSFSRWSPDIQSDYLWGCTEMAKQAKAFTKQLIIRDEPAEDETEL